MSAARRLSRLEMRLVLAIEDDLNDRRGLHLSDLDAFVRREIRQSWKRIVVDPPVGFAARRLDRPTR